MQAKKPSRAWYVLILLPVVGVLWVPFYNMKEPSLFGFPFFYWYQLLWVPVSAVLIGIVYKKYKS